MKWNNFFKAWKSTFIGVWMIIGAGVYTEIGKADVTLKTIIVAALIGGGIKMVTGDDLNEKKDVD